MMTTDPLNERWDSYRTVVRASIWRLVLFSHKDEHSDQEMVEKAVSEWLDDHRPRCGGCESGEVR